MLEGFWIFRIQPPPVSSGGVMMFALGKVYGGDSGFAWVGTYSVSNNIIRARVRVHNFDHDIKSVLGLEGDYDMHFSGTQTGDTIVGTALIANQPQHSLAIRLEKYAQL